MRRSLRSRLPVLSIVLTFASLALSAQAPPASRLAIPTEPTPNLGRLKTRLVAYHSCTKPAPNCYVPSINRQADLAIAFLRRRVARAKPGEKMAVVFDIDETALSNWDEEVADDFGYIGKDWNAWVMSKKCTAIAGTLRVYNEAIRLGAAVFFITGRGKSPDPAEDQEAATAENLKSAGYTVWAGLTLRGPHPPGQTVTQYKSGEREKIAANYHIILNMGDQMSDLDGPAQAEYSVKLPNPFYYIP